MNMAKKGFTVLFGFLLIAGVFAAGNAIAAGHDEQGMQGQTGQLGRAEQKELTGQVGQQSEANFDPFFGLLHDLNLTDAQKAQVADILKANEAEAKTIAKELANAGVQIRKDFMKGTFNPDHFDTWVKYEKQGAQFRATTMASILPKLTHEQQTTLQSMQDQVGSNINSAIDSRFARLDDWIAKHNK
jgi:hypothetical protein